MASSTLKPEIWWCAVTPEGVTLWPSLQLRKCDVIECLNRDTPNWKKAGWRVAKLHVEEWPQRG